MCRIILLHIVFTYLSVYLFIDINLIISISIPLYLSIYLSDLSIYLYIRSIYLSIYIYISAYFQSGRSYSDTEPIYQPGAYAVRLILLWGARIFFFYGLPTEEFAKRVREKSSQLCFCTEG